MKRRKSSLAMFLNSLTDRLRKKIRNPQMQTAIMFKRNNQPWILIWEIRGVIREQETSWYQRNRTSKNFRITTRTLNCLKAWRCLIINQDVSSGESSYQWANKTIWAASSTEETDAFLIDENSNKIQRGLKQRSIFDSTWVQAKQVSICEDITTEKYRNKWYI